jgi:hypothetical protein
MPSVANPTLSVQRVEGQPAPGKGNSFAKLPTPLLRMGDGDEHIPQRLAQTFALKKLPVIKGGAIGERKPCHEIIAIEIGCRYQAEQCIVSSAATCC